MRMVFETLDELKKYIHTNPEMCKKKIAYRVTIDGKTKYTLSGNSDQGVASVTRNEYDVEINSVGLAELCN